MADAEAGSDECVNVEESVEASASEDGQEEIAEEEGGTGITAGWGLAPAAIEGAEALYKLVPDMIITSGLRDRSSEAGAWAFWVAQQQRWILDVLYWGVRDPTLIELQEAIDADWDSLAGDSAAIAELIESHFNTMSDADMAKVSPHATGMAIDVAPNEAYTEAMMTGLPNVSQALNEDNHWHIGFHQDSGAESEGTGL